MGWNGFSVDTARTPMTNMGQTLFEPPDVAGSESGAGGSPPARCYRMNFAAMLALNQRFNLSRDAAAYRSSPDNLLAEFHDGALSLAPFDTLPTASW